MCVFNKNISIPPDIPTLFDVSKLAWCSHCLMFPRLSGCCPLPDVPTPSWYFRSCLPSVSTPAWCSHCLMSPLPVVSTPASVSPHCLIFLSNGRRRFHAGQAVSTPDLPGVSTPHLPSVSTPALPSVSTRDAFCHIT